MDKKFIKNFLNWYFDNKEVIGIFHNEYDDELYYQYKEDDNVFISEFDLFHGQYEDKNFDINFGATKVAFIFEKEDIVLKLSICGTIEFDETEEVRNKYCIEPYHQNYIEYGQDLFEESKYKKLLLPHSYVCSYGEIDVYVQDKFLPYYYANTETKEKYRYPIRDVDLDKIINNEVRKLATDFISAIMNCYKINEVDLMDFDFEDMNPTNYGYTLEGRPVISDWEGFHDFK